MQSEFDEILRSIRIIPVAKVSNLELITPLSAALVEGGLPIIEITLRTPCALAAIRRATQLDNFFVGAGTVLSAEQAQSAIDAGASFIVSPGLDEGVIECCRGADVPVYPGVATATEVQRAYNLGIRSVKFFPAEPNGGCEYLSALAAPFHEMQFVPTGGIKLTNLADYLAMPSTLAVGGSWMVSPKLYENGNFDSVSETVSIAVAQTRS